MHSITPSSTLEPARLLRRTRILLLIMIIGLVLSGITAFALETEMKALARWLGADARATPEQYSGFTHWVVKIRNGLEETYAKYPFVAYGTDWLAFAHLVLAVLFLGALRDPVRNIWVITFGLIACISVIPLAFICGAVREIPIGWRLIDCSFGIIGTVPLLLARQYTLRLAFVMDVKDLNASTCI